DRRDPVVLQPELERPEGPEVAVEQHLTGGERADLDEEARRHRGQLEQVRAQDAQRGEALAQDAQALVGGLLGELLLEQQAALAIVGELALDEAAEDELLIAVRIEQAPREAQRPLQRLAHVEQLLAQVALGLLLAGPRDRLSAEGSLHAAQQD